LYCTFCCAMSLWLITYNVLSPNFCSQEKYPRCSIDAVDPDKRLERILAQVKGFTQRRQGTRARPVLCLQEVSLSWASKLYAMFDAQGYKWISEQYSSPSSDYMGVLVAWPSEDFVLKDSLVKRVSDLLPSQPDEDDGFLSLSVSKIFSGLVTCTSTREKDFDEYTEARRANRIIYTTLFHRHAKEEFVIGNYHMPCLFGSAAKVRVVNMHAAAIVEELHRIAEGKPCILTGDFNFDPSTPPYRMITTGRLSRADPTCPRYFPDGVDLPPMRSAYSERNGKEPEFTNNVFVEAGPFTEVLDYIFLSERSATAEPDWDVQEVLPLPRLSDVQRENKEADAGVFYPTAEQPSDHLPIGAHLSFHSKRGIFSGLGSRKNLKDDLESTTS